MKALLYFFVRLDLKVSKYILQLLVDITKYAPLNAE